jgi:hypothetical protein
MCHLAVYETLTWPVNIAISDETESLLNIALRIQYLYSI